MKTEREHTAKDSRVYDSRPILMNDDDLKRMLREADAECLVRKHEKATVRTLRASERGRLEAIAFRSLNAGKTDREAMDEIRRAAR